MAERPRIVEPPELRTAPSTRRPYEFEVPRPEFTIVDEEPLAGEAQRVTAVEERSGSALPDPRREPVTIDARHPLTQLPYPPASIRPGEKGTVTIELRIGVDGRVRKSRLLRSSDPARLDAAALEEALRLRRLKPATVDGAPVEAWHAVRVSFRLDRS